MQAATVDPVVAARRWARLYRRLGFQPLPSRQDEKRPLVRFAEWWESEAPSNLWTRHATTNIQIMTGRYWRLAVIDLDGPEAVKVWPTLGPYYPRTWETGTGGGGKHIWYSLPDGLDPIPKARLWGKWDAQAREGRGDWEKHTAIELLCDRSLVMAPPSVHPKTGKVYRFEPGRSPVELFRPAMIPAWVLKLPRLSAPRPEVPEPAPTLSRLPFKPIAGRVESRDVMDAIPSKTAVARGWGLRFASSPQTSKGWVSVHDYNREDSHPSARFHLDSGSFWRPGEPPISLFDLGVALGHYSDWRECRAALASEYGVSSR